MLGQQQAEERTLADTVCDIDMIICSPAIHQLTIELLARPTPLTPLLFSYFLATPAP